MKKDNNKTVAEELTFDIKIDGSGTRAELIKELLLLAKELETAEPDYQNGIYSTGTLEAYLTEQ